MAQTDTPLRRRSTALAIITCTFCSFAGALAWGAVPKEPTAALDQKAFFRPELVISTSNVPLESVLAQLPNRQAWEAYLQSRGEDPSRLRMPVFVDPRSGTVSNLVGPFPLIPGNGVGNRLTLAALVRSLGRPIARVDAGTEIGRAHV